MLPATSTKPPNTGDTARRTTNETDDTSSEMAFQVKTAVIVVDVQNDFLLGGSLAVPNGNEVIPVIQEVLKEDWDVVVASQVSTPSPLPYLEPVSAAGGQPRAACLRQ